MVKCQWVEENFSKLKYAGYAFTNTSDMVRASNSNHDEMHKIKIERLWLRYIWSSIVSKAGGKGRTVASPDQQAPIHNYHSVLVNHIWNTIINKEN